MNFWCKWIGHRKRLMKNQINVAWCKRCGELMKWDDRLYMEYKTQNQFLVSKSLFDEWLESNPESK